MRGTVFGVPIIRIILFGVYLDMKIIWEFPKIMGTYWEC